MSGELFIHTSAKDIRVTLERRGDGAHYHATFWHRGVRHRESTECAVLAKAKARARDMVLEALEAAPASGGLPISSAVIQYIDARFPEAARDVEKPRSPDERDRTYENCQTRLNAFAAGCGGDTDLAMLTYDQAVAMTQQYLSRKKSEGNGARSVRNAQSVLSGFFRWLLRTRDRAGHGRPLVPWKFNPASSDELDLDDPDSVLLPALSDAEVERFINAARDPGKAQGRGHNRFSGRPRMAWRIVLLCLGCGARPIEALRAKWAEVDWQRGTIILRAKKRSREIRMSEWVLGHLRELRKADAEEVETICQCNADAKNLRLKRLRKAFGLPAHFNFQALRRTAARKAAPTMTTYQYAKYFGHSLAVAEKHYLDMGLVGDAGAVNVLAFEPKVAVESATKTATNERRASA